MFSAVGLKGDHRREAMFGERRVACLPFLEDRGGQTRRRRCRESETFRWALVEKGRVDIVVDERGYGDGIDGLRAESMSEACESSRGLVVRRSVYARDDQGCVNALLPAAVVPAGAADQAALLVRQH